MSKLETNTVDSISGTSTLTLGGSNASVVSAGTEVRSNKLSPASGTALQIGDSGDTITIPSGATIVNSGTQTGFGGVNTPAFFAYQTSNQTIANNTNTVVSLDTEAFDTDNAFASNTFTVPAGEGGKYFFTIGIRKNDFTSTRFNLYLENQSAVSLLSLEHGTDSSYGTANGSTIVNLSAGNTVVMKIYQNQGGSQTTLQGIHQTFFGGYKLIGV